jgi:hypothetical protein
LVSFDEVWSFKKIRLENPIYENYIT